MSVRNIQLESSHITFPINTSLKGFKHPLMNVIDSINIFLIIAIEHFSNAVTPSVILSQTLRNYREAGVIYSQINTYFSNQHASDQCLDKVQLQMMSFLRIFINSWILRILMLPIKNITLVPLFLFMLRLSLLSEFIFRFSFYF